MSKELILDNESGEIRLEATNQPIKLIGGPDAGGVELSVRENTAAGEGVGGSISLIAGKGRDGTVSSGGSVAITPGGGGDDATSSGFGGDLTITSGAPGQSAQQYTVFTGSGAAYNNAGPGEYWVFYSANNATRYYVWYNVIGGTNTDPSPSIFGVFPAPSSTVGIQVDINAADASSVVASNTKSQIDSVASADVTTSNLSGNSFRVVNDALGYAADPRDYTTGVTAFTYIGSYANSPDGGDITIQASPSFQQLSNRANGGNLYLYSGIGSPLYSDGGNGGSIEIAAGPAFSATRSAGGIVIRAGSGLGHGAGEGVNRGASGGDIDIVAGSAGSAFGGGGSTTGFPGDVNIRAGESKPGNTRGGGDIVVKAGKTDSAQGGRLSLRAGSGSANAANQIIGSPSPTPKAHAGGAIDIVAGLSSLGGTGGPVYIRAGNGSEGGDAVLAAGSGVGGAGGDLLIRAGRTDFGSRGGDINIRAGDFIDETDQSIRGGDVYIRSGREDGIPGEADQNWASLFLEHAQGATTEIPSSEGGKVDLIAGAGYARGGGIRIEAGDSSKICGDLDLIAGDNTGSQDGGTVLIRAGDGNDDPLNRPLFAQGTTASPLPETTMSVNIKAGNTSTTGAYATDAGVVNISGGTAADGQGGGIYLKGGDASGDGGDISLLGGIGTNSDGGLIRIYAGSGKGSSGGDGGDVDIDAGGTTGTATKGGNVFIEAGAAPNTTAGSKGIGNIGQGGGDIVMTTGGRDDGTYAGNHGEFYLFGSDAEQGSRIKLMGIGGAPTKSVTLGIPGDDNFIETAHLDFTLPSQQGLGGQVLTTDGTGILSWANVSAVSASGGGQIQADGSYTPEGGAGLGLGQQWSTTNLNGASRSANVSYTNSSTCPIAVAVTFITYDDTNSSLIVNGVEVAKWDVEGLTGVGPDYYYRTLYAVIPAGQTYLAWTRGSAIAYWTESTTIGSCTSPGGLGVNQTWQGTTNQPTLTYQNTSGSPIAVSVKLYVGNGERVALRTNASAPPSAGTDEIAQFQAATIGTGSVTENQITLFGIIPNGYYYDVTRTGSSYSFGWYELRGPTPVNGGGLGVGQTWAVTANVANTDYQNTDSCPRHVQIMVNGTGAGGASTFVTADDSGGSPGAYSTVCYEDPGSVTVSNYAITVTVPAGQWYRLNTTETILQWSEMSGGTCSAANLTKIIDGDLDTFVRVAQSATGDEDTIEMRVGDNVGDWDVSGNIMELSTSGVTVDVPDATGNNANGGGITLEGGDADGTGVGGAIFLQPGYGSTAPTIPTGSGIPQPTEMWFVDGDSTPGYVGFKAPSAVSTGSTGDGNDTVWVLPEGDGQSDALSSQVMYTDGSAVLSWGWIDTIRNAAGDTHATVSNAGSGDAFRIDTEQWGVNWGPIGDAVYASSVIFSVDLTGAETGSGGGGTPVPSVLAGAKIDLRAGDTGTSGQTGGDINLIAGDAPLGNGQGGTVTIESGPGYDAGDILLAVGADGGNDPGHVIISAGLTSAAVDLRFHDDSDAQYVGFKAPSDVTANNTGDGVSVTWVLPEGDAVQNGNVLASDGSGVLRWERMAYRYNSGAAYAGVAETTDITMPTSASISDGQYFTIYNANDATGYYVWFNVNGGGGDPAPGGGLVAIPVIVTSPGDSATTVAINTAAAIAAAGGASDFTVPVPTTPTFTVTNQAVGPSTDAANVDVGGPPTFSVTQQGQSHVINHGLGQWVDYTIYDRTTGARIGALANEVATSTAGGTLVLTPTGLQDLVVMITGAPNLPDNT